MYVVNKCEKYGYTMHILIKHILNQSNSPLHKKRSNSTREQNVVIDSAFS